LTPLSLNLSEAARAVGARNRAGFSMVALSGVSTDSRTVGPGELFFALRGERMDGHRFLKDAFDRGASAAVISEDVGTCRKGPCLRVEDTTRALGDLAGYLRRRHPLKVAAVTGSNGKTTTKEMLKSILGRKFKTLATEGNFNNLIGLPLTLFRLRDEHEAAVLEMGMNQFGEIARLTEIAAPDMGLITNVGPAHIGGVGGIEGVARAKGELFAGLASRAVAVVNLDDAHVVKAAETVAGPRLTFGSVDEARVRLRGLRSRGLQGVRFELVMPAGRAEVRLPLLGRHNAFNALAAAAAAVAFEMTPADIRAGLEAVKPAPGRLEIKKLAGPVYVLDDTYNANPASTRAALEVLAGLKGRGRALAVLGDMLELGRNSRSRHEDLGRYAAELGLDLLVAVGPRARYAAGGAEAAGLDGRVVHFRKADQAGTWLKTHIRPLDRVLVKGSRGMKMETVIDCLKEGA